MSQRDECERIVRFVCLSFGPPARGHAHARSRVSGGACTRFVATAGNFIRVLVLRLHSDLTLLRVPLPLRSRLGVVIFDWPSMRTYIYDGAAIGMPISIPI